MIDQEHRPDIEYIQHPASSNLMPFVQRILRGFSEQPRLHRLTIPPSDGIFLSIVRGTPLTVHIDGQPPRLVKGLFIGGQLKRASPILECQGYFDLIGIQFTPTGFHRLFNLDVFRFTDQCTDFMDVLPETAKTLTSHWMKALPDEHLFGIVEDRLIELIPHAVSSDDVEQAIEFIEEHNGQIRVEQLSTACNTNPRQLHRRFLKVVGVGPKQLAKTVQLKSVLMAMESTDDTSLKNLAQEYGYFDQSHFVHDFQRFIGMNPQAFLQSDTPFLDSYLLQQARHS